MSSILSTDKTLRDHQHIKVQSAQETRLKQELQSRTDAESQRIERYLAMPDLSRTEGSPLRELVKRIVNLPDFKDFDVIQVPEIVPADISFDLFDFPKDHPARSKSDTYYADSNHILRTHTTVMWYYYLKHPAIKRRIANGEAVGSFCYGKVYRKDEIDRHHMNVFHNMDGWYLIPKDQKIITSQDLQDVLAIIAKSNFGLRVKYRFNEDTFPYTVPSLEMEIDKGDGKWLEVVGAGIVKGSVLDKLGVDSAEYNGWAFGFGLERLAMISMELPDIRLFWSQDGRVKKQLVLGNKFREVSKFPSITRDISFIVDKSFVPNDYFDLIRDIGGDLVEEVRLLDKYEDLEKFGRDKVSYTYRVVYRSPQRTLTAEEVEKLQSRLYQQTKMQYKADLR